MRAVCWQLRHGRCLQDQCSEEDCTKAEIKRQENKSSSQGNDGSCSESYEIVHADEPSLSCQLLFKEAIPEETYRDR